MVTVDHVLQQAGAQVDQITALAVTTGPGSFTGVRIAISTVKGLGLGLSQPPHVIGMPTLCVTAAPWLEPAGAIMPQPTVCAYIQAGRGRYNWVLFDPGDELRRPSAEEHGAGTFAEFGAALAALAPRPVWLVGELDGALSAASRRTGSPLYRGPIQQSAPRRAASAAGQAAS